MQKIMVHKSKKKYDRKATKRAVIAIDDSSFCFHDNDITTPYGKYMSLPEL